ncbi:fimbrillin family protein [uncultured Parabacteroides sp.]|uniref:fimbrillin family protein n=1 Tax=uncultured Parabacteroides sp. TaxID=512312 RepID=UPI0025F0A995|nr:fimbrillin family protein [uncultured Parabacteroides sp.]
MKKVCMYAAMLAVLLSACSSDEETQGGNETPEIRLGAIVSDAVTKAPVVTGDTFKAAITALETSSSPYWTGTPTWQNTITLTASPEISGKWIPLDVSKVYPNSGNVYMAAWHPAIASENGVVNFMMTGTEDVMYGGIVSGSRQNPVSSPFTFGHLLTQLNFRAEATEEFLTANPGKAVSKIEIVGGQYPRSMTIADGKVTYDESRTPVVPGLAQHVLSSNLETVGESLMIGAMSSIKIKVWYADGNNSGEITINLAADTKKPLEVKAGYAHTIHLVFQGRNEIVILATGSVSEWKTGESGNGMVTN